MTRRPSSFVAHRWALIDALSSIEATMCLNACLASGLVDAVYLCGMIDLALLASGVYTVTVGTRGPVREEADYNNGQNLAACVGLLASAVLWRFSKVRPMVQLSCMLAFASFVAYIVVVILVVRSTLAVREAVARLTVEIEDNYWPFAYLNAFVVVVITINHGLLAYFARILDQRQANGDAQVSAEDVLVGRPAGGMMVL